MKKQQQRVHRFNLGHLPLCLPFFPTLGATWTWPSSSLAIIVILQCLLVSNFKGRRKRFATRFYLFSIRFWQKCLFYCWIRTLCITYLTNFIPLIWFFFTTYTENSQNRIKIRNYWKSIYGEQKQFKKFSCKKTRRYCILLNAWK